MQAHAVHQLVHDEGGTRHIAGVLHEGDEEVENQDLRQEHDDASHTTDDTVHEHRPQGALAHRGAYPFAQPCHAGLYPVHGVLAEGEGRLEHHVENQEEDGEAQKTVRQQVVDAVCGVVGVRLRARPELCFGESTVDEAVFGIHDGCLGIYARLLQHTCCGIVACSHQALAVFAAVFALHVTLHVVDHLRVVLQQLQCHIARGVLCAQVLIGLQELLDMRDAVFYLVAIVDVDVPRLRIHALIDLNDSVEEFLYTASALERCRHHRDTEQRGERVEVHVVAA